MFSETQSTEKRRLLLALSFLMKCPWLLGFSWVGENRWNVSTRGNLVAHGELLLPRVPGTGSPLIREKLVLHLAYLVDRLRSRQIMVWRPWECLSGAKCPVSEYDSEVLSECVLASKTLRNQAAASGTQSYNCPHVFIPQSLFAPWASTRMSIGRILHLSVPFNKLKKNYFIEV